MKNIKCDSIKEYQELPQDRKKILNDWISNNLTSIKNINANYTSYGLKDLVERDINEYFSNDEFKGAMLEMGFKSDNQMSLNWSFNVSTKSINEVFHRINSARKDVKISR